MTGSPKNIDNKSAYYYDFWRSCDTEDWSNDAENTALITEINYSLTHIHTEIGYLKLEKYFTILQFFLCIFNEIISALTSKSDFFQSISLF